jgi:hypothetical protein
MKTKICSKCKIEKEVCEFYKKSVNNKGIQYYKSRCKKCQSEDDKIKRDENREKYKTWYDKNREERNKWRTEYYQKNKEKIISQNKNQYIKRNLTRNQKYNKDPIFKIQRLLLKITSEPKFLKKKS